MLLIAEIILTFSILENEGTVGVCPFGAKPRTWYWNLALDEFGL
jgi:hypothetical protein